MDINRTRRIYRRQMAQIERKQPGVQYDNIEQLREFQRELKATYQEMFKAVSDDELDDLIDEQGNYLEQLEQYIHQAQGRRQQHTSRQDTMQIQLPTSSLPTFSGNIREWRSFSDQFKTMIDERAGLSDVQKMQYLSSSVRGEAARVIQHLEIRNENYSVAWELLEKRYYNPRQAVMDVVEKLLLENKRSKTLRERIDNFNEFDHILQKMVPDLRKQLEVIYITLLSKDLDNETIQAWELAQPNKEIPELKDFINFLEVRARAAERNNTAGNNQQRFNKEICLLCKNDHHLRQCKKFGSKTVEEKWETVRNLKVCFNCLSTGHSVIQCRSRPCNRCEKRHHSSLHRDVAATVAATLRTNDRSIETLLPTMQITVLDQQGRKQRIRALLDTGSHMNIISQEVVSRLGLKPLQSRKEVRTINGRVNLQEEVKLVLLIDGRSVTVLCSIITNLQTTLPTTKIKGTVREAFKNLSLADPTFDKPAKIDLIIGMATGQHLLRGELQTAGRNFPVAIKTAVGWSIVGSVKKRKPNTKPNHCNLTLQSQVERLWMEDQVTPRQHYTPEERECERMFQATHSRNKDGSYVVKLPWRDNVNQLTGSREIARRHFLVLEKRFHKDPNLKKQYVEAIRDFQNKGHMVRVHRKNDLDAAYLPHHAVIREDKDTTKLRVVFDGSARNPGASSLNDALLNGPRIQDDLFDILIRFRNYQIGFTADIEQMYRQIQLHSSEYDRHRIFWRENQQGPIEEFYLTTLTFGLKCSPYLATRVLKQLAQDEEEGHKKAANILRNDFYVDDLLSGCEEINEGKEICKQLDNLLSAGGFNLRKWSSNCTQVLEGLPIYKLRSTEEEQDQSENIIKTLGIQWNPKDDIFKFEAQTQVNQEKTKRVVLSTIAKTFDPLGWLSPFTIRGKIIFQELWKIQCDWDDQIPDPISGEWSRYQEELSRISTIRIPRRLATATGKKVLCGFADASEQAYAAVVYLRTQSSVGVEVTLVAAKARVTSLKPVTIPRLELNGALLLAKLLKRIAEQLKIEEVYAWTDSSVVLAWIRGHAARWKIYVGHRVAEIQELTAAENWNYIRTTENPADCASRGISIEELRNNKLWWNGPAFLKNEDFLKKSEENIDNNIREVRREERQERVTHLVVLPQSQFPIYSNHVKTLRVLAYVLRFVKRKNIPKTRCITVKELRTAELYYIRCLQKDNFEEEISDLKRIGQVRNGSNLKTLDPFLDDDGILRVGGRLKHAEIPTETKHQIILPRNTEFTRRLIEWSHRLHCHAGPLLLLAILRQKYWIINGKQIIKKVIHECLQCHRFTAKAAMQKMGDLPPDRIRQNPAFTICGVDYAGPIVLRLPTRKNTTYKGYIAIFICFSTKAMHLEVVTSLATQGFIAALRRFVARRGLCKKIVSDCGTNFVGANKELKNMLKAAIGKCADEDITNELAKMGIEWQFNPPGAPHFGGLWEAGVRSVKTHLRRIVGRHTLNIEEMMTTLCQIEACLNSRPICDISSSPEDFEALTPGHFLIGRPLLAIPEELPDLTSIAFIRRYQLCQHMVHQFWKKWSMEYLSRLQSKPKWFKQQKNLETNQLVLIIEDNLPPCMWKLGRIEEVHPGTDNLVRVVTVRTATGIKRRPISKVSPLPIVETPGRFKGGGNV